MTQVTTPATRSERDLLGAREVPSDAYWGIHTLRARENFRISGHTFRDFPQAVHGMVQVKKAAAAANADLGKLDREIADAIIAACDRILLDNACLDQFPLDVFQGGAGTSLNMNTNEVVANLALEIIGRPKGDYDTINPNDDVNMSQSTNDAYPTGFRLALIAGLEALDADLAVLHEALAIKADEFATIMKIGRTQLQDAVPMTLGQEFAAFAVLIDEERRNLRRVGELLLEINLGATAIGTGINTPEGYRERVVARLAEFTGLPVVSSPNLIEATSDCGAYVSVHGALKRVAVKFSKISNDLRLLSSGPRAGLGEISLPEMQAGSSIMPGKVNPVIPEVVSQVAYKVMGNDVAVTAAAEAGQLQLNAMEPVIAQCSFESLTLLGRASLTLAERCVSGIKANVEVCESNVRNSIGLVTYLNTALGHAVCDEIAQECQRSGRSVREVTLERGLLSEADLDALLSFSAIA